MNEPDNASSDISIAVTSFTLYYFTSLVVIFGALFGTYYVRLCVEHSDSTGIVTETFAGTFAPWDGVWYRRIATEGYFYDEDRMSSVAFFPLYPLFGQAISAMTGLHIEYSLWLASHLFLIGAFVLLASYLRKRSTALSVEQRDYSLLALGLFPTTFYLRMSYSESVFLFTALLAIDAMARRRPLWVIALIAGVSTASRPTGVALLLPLAWHVWKESSSMPRFLARMIVLVPAACWGLLAYMVYQWHVFGDPLAFVKTQIHWYERMPPETVWGNLWSYGTLEPFRQVYDADCPCYWALDPPREMPIFNMQFMNPIFVFFAWLAIAYGGIRRWLTSYELLLSAGLLGIPYILQSYRSCMASGARYASVVFPVYIVLGILLSRCPREVVCAIGALSAVFLGIYSALFVSWYWFY